MKTFEYIIKDPVGLHARPASKMVQELTSFKSKVTVTLGDKTANAKSIINLMSLGIKNGSKITITIEGEDEVELSEKIGEILEKHQI